MKVSKVFGCVLGLHFGVITILLVQPGCRTKQPPTQTFTQERTSSTATSSGPARTEYTSDRTIRSSVQGASRDSTGLIEATRLGSGEGLDSAFNAGFDDGSYAPTNAGNEFGEFDDVAPIAPLSSGGQTVQIAGASMEAYTVKKGDNLWTIAKRYNVSLNDIYAANGLNKNSVLRIGQQIQIPVVGSTASVATVNADVYQPSSFNQGSTNYTVKRGDTLSKIANQFDTSVRAIKAANNKGSDMIRVGEELVIPVTGSASGSPAASTAPVTNAVSRSPSVSNSMPSGAVSTSGTRTHTVKSGEFPATIARKYGMTTGELLALNGITDPRKLQVGQVLKVSGSGSAANVDSRTETVVSPAGAPAAVQASRPVTTTPAPASFSAPRPASGTAPVEIRVVEADPLIEGEITEIQTDQMFEGAVEIPVIRLEE